MDQVLALLVPILGFLESIPAVGPVIVVVVKLALPMVALATAFVVLWHGVVVFLKALGAIPGLSFFNAIADKLHTSEERVDGVISDDIIPILNRLSALPVPSLPAPAAPKPPGQ